MLKRTGWLIVSLSFVVGALFYLGTAKWATNQFVSGELDGTGIVGDWEFTFVEVDKVELQNNEGVKFRIYADGTGMRVIGGTKEVMEGRICASPLRITKQSNGKFLVHVCFLNEKNLEIVKVLKDELHLKSPILSLAGINHEFVLTRLQGSKANHLKTEQALDSLFVALGCKNRREEGLPLPMDDILKASPDLNGAFFGVGGVTPIEVEAACYGRKEMIQQLMDAGGELDRGGFGAVYSCINHNPQLISWLIDKGADASGNSTHSTLEIAMKKADPKVLDQLLAAGAKFNTPNDPSEFVHEYVLEHKELNKALLENDSIALLLRDYSMTENPLNIQPLSPDVRSRVLCLFLLGQYGVVDSKPINRAFNWIPAPPRKSNRDPDQLDLDDIGRLTPPTFFRRVNAIVEREINFLISRALSTQDPNAFSLAEETINLAYGSRSLRRRELTGARYDALCRLRNE